MMTITAAVFACLAVRFVSWQTMMVWCTFQTQLQTRLQSQPSLLDLSTARLMSALQKSRRLWWDGFILGGDKETALTLVGTLSCAQAAT
jgi:hypothetical protein